MTAKKNDAPAPMQGEANAASVVPVAPKKIDREGVPIGDVRKIVRLPDGRVEGETLDLPSDNEGRQPPPPDDTARGLLSSGQPIGGPGIPLERETLAEAAKVAIPQRIDIPETQPVPDRVPLVGDRPPGIEWTEARALARDIMNRSELGLEAEMEARYPNDPNYQQTPAPKTAEQLKQAGPEKVPNQPGYKTVRVLKKGDGQVSKGTHDPASGAQGYYAKGEEFVIAESIALQLEDRGFVEIS